MTKQEEIEGELLEIINWLIARRRVFNEIKRQHALKKPKDKQRMMIFGNKG